MHRSDVSLSTSERPARAGVGRLERLALVGALALTVVLAFGARSPSQSADASGGARSAPGEVRLATIDLFKLMELLLASDRYRPIIEAKQTELRASLQTLQDELQALRTKIEGMPAETPDRQQLITEWQQKNQSLQQQNQAAMGEMQSLTMTQLQEGYRIVVEASDAAATRLGYTHVLYNRSGPLEFRSTQPEGAFQELLLRPLIKGVAGDDLTTAVMNDLKLEEPKPTPPPAPAPADPNAPAAPAAGGSGAPATAKP